MKTIALSFFVTLAVILTSCGGGGGGAGGSGGTASVSPVTSSVLVTPISIGMTSVLMASDGN